ncbi:hypothetical protein N2152v2_009605 [Parachlorella kessleri]
MATITPQQREAAERNRKAALRRRALRELHMDKQNGQQRLHTAPHLHKESVNTTPQAGVMQQAPSCWCPRQAGQHEQQRRYQALQVSVHASEVAALAGLHPRQSREETILRLWRRVHPTSFRRSAEGAQLMRVERLAAAACAGSAPAQESLAALQLAESICGGPCTAALKPALGQTGDAAAPAAKAAVGAEVESPGSLADPREVRRCIKSRIFRSFGQAREDPVFELLRGQGGLPDLQRDSRVYGALVDEGQQHAWVLSGRIDGKVESDEGGLVVVEIKNRVRRLFARVRRHERVQVEAYIRLLGADRAALAECFTGPGGSMDVLVHWVDRDDSLWEQQVLPSLRDAVAEVRARVRGARGPERSAGGMSLAGHKP